MFTRRNRATTETVQKVLTSGKTKHSAVFSVRYLPSDDVKVSVVVSKKVCKTAVARNTLKRRMRAAIDPQKLSPKSYIVYAKKGADTLSPRALKNELMTLLTA